MSDFEERVSRALADGAEGAPAAGGLAAVARARRARRVRRRAVVGAVVAVAALGVGGAVTAAVVGDGPDGRPDPAQTDEAATTWSTVTLDGVDVSVPEDWVELDTSACDDGRSVPVGAPGTDGCDLDGTVSVFGGATYDPPQGPGVLAGSVGSGYVYVGQQVVQVVGLEYEVARRVLASARPEGEPDPVGDRAWRTDSGCGGVQTPEVDGLDVDCLLIRSSGTSIGSQARQRPDGTWVAHSRPTLGFGVRVRAPTQALADVIAASVQRSQGWRTFAVEDLVLDVPRAWVRLDMRGCQRKPTALAPAGSDPCRSRTGVYVALEAAYRIVSPVLLTADNGLVKAGRRVVFVRGLPLDVTRRVLASVRPVDDPAPDVVTWSTIDLGDGVTAEVPADDRVEVTLSDGVPECTTAGIGPAEEEDGSWRVQLCRNRIVTVRAPTEALALVVAARVEGW